MNRCRARICDHAAEALAHRSHRAWICRGFWLEGLHATGMICGIPLPSGLREAEKIPGGAIFTPQRRLGTERTMKIFPSSRPRNYWAVSWLCKCVKKQLPCIRKRRITRLTKGIIIADTKFEFGQDDEGELYLIDEALTPDSSRFWPADQYRPGKKSPQL